MNNKGGHPKNSINSINSSSGVKENPDAFRSIGSTGGNSQHLEPTRKKAIDPTSVGGAGPNFEAP